MRWSLFVVLSVLLVGCSDKPLPEEGFEDTYHVTMLISEADEEGMGHVAMGISGLSYLKVTQRQRDGSLTLHSRPLWLQIAAGWRSIDTREFDGESGREKALLDWMQGGVDLSLDGEGNVLEVKAANPEALQKLNQSGELPLQMLVGEGPKPLALPATLEAGSSWIESRDLGPFGTFPVTYRVENTHGQMVALTVSGPGDKVALAGRMVARLDNGMPVSLRMIADIQPGAIPKLKAPIRQMVALTSQRYADEISWFSQDFYDPDFGAEMWREIYADAYEVAPKDNQLRQKNNGYGEALQYLQGLMLRYRDGTVAVRGNREQTGSFSGWLRLKQVRLLDAAGRQLPLDIFPNRLFETYWRLGELNSQKSEGFPWILADTRQRETMADLDRAELDVIWNEQRLGEAWRVAAGESAARNPAMQIQWGKQAGQIREAVVRVSDDNQRVEVARVLGSDGQPMPFKYASWPLRLDADLQKGTLDWRQAFLADAGLQEGRVMRLQTEAPMAAIEFYPVLESRRPKTLTVHNIAKVIEGDQSFGHSK